MAIKYDRDVSKISNNFILGQHNDSTDLKGMFEQKEQDPIPLDWDYKWTNVPSNPKGLN